MAVRRIDAGMMDIGGAPVPVEVRVNPRARRLILRLGRERMITVTCPSTRHVPAALAMVKTQQAWIADQIAQTPAAIPFAIGSALTIEDTRYIIEAAPSARSAARFIGNSILVGGVESNAIARRVETLLRKTAQKSATRQARVMAAELGVTLGPISVRQMTSRWGSCSVDGALSFNWRLIAAPSTVFTYVIAHEVAHRMEMNHSPAFWKIVKRLDPGYRKSADWLRDFGATLHAFGRTNEHPTTNQALERNISENVG